MDSVIEKVMYSLLNAFHLQLNEEKISSFIQFIKFGMVGITNTLLSYVINVAVLFILKDKNVSWDFVAGNVVSFIISVAWSFYWNNRFVFNSGNNDSWIAKLLKSYLSYGFTGIVLSNILSYIWISVFGISKYIAPIINLIISVPLNFIIHKVWVYH